MFFTFNGKFFSSPYLLFFYIKKDVHCLKMQTSGNQRKKREIQMYFVERNLNNKIHFY